MHFTVSKRHFLHAGGRHQTGLFGVDANPPFKLLAEGRQKTGLFG
jgi:hypothetical protein